MNPLTEEFKKNSQTTIQSLKKEISGIRTNRPSPALLENLKVNLYDQMMPLKQVGSIHVAPPREIDVQVWDKSAVVSVVKAIDGANLGLSANADGNLIRVHLPELTAERKEEIIKHIKKITEQYRMQLRHFRDEINKKIQKSFDGGEINEDQKFKLKEEVQKETNKAGDEIEKILEEKIKEIEN